MPGPTENRSSLVDTAIPWIARAAWLLTAFVGGAAIDGALDGRDRPVQVVATLAAWAGFAVGAGALALAGIATLTVCRAVIPGALVVAASCALAGAGALSVVGLAVPGAVATLAVGSASFGRTWVQAAAYGDEARFVLRPPLGYLAATVFTWLLAAVATVTAIVAVPDSRWIIGIVAAIIAVGVTAIAGPRWHQLSRRWLVLVPAGVVVHDPVVLADTVLLQRAMLAGLTFAPERGAPTAAGAADLTGPTPGPGVVIVLVDPTAAVLAPSPRAPSGTPLVLDAMVIAPTRPGAALREAKRRNLPVR